MQKKAKFSFLLCCTVLLVEPAHPQTMSKDMHGEPPPVTLSTHELNGSGTSWLPSKSPMYTVHSQDGKWMAMHHGSAYGRFTQQNALYDDRRGENAIDGPNWIMTMWDRRLNEKNAMRVRGMFSLDPLTEGDDGYPLLFQTGEAYQGNPLVDRQHPHDFFMELAVTEFYRPRPDMLFFAYFGLPGEPALGPTPFMHRPSGDMNPDAPLGHHWQDATHITFGVFTLGGVFNRLKLDASIFTGREPDENRWNFDQPLFDSYSGRLSFMFSPGIEGQVSAGYLHSPETLHPETDQVRMTASITTVSTVAAFGTFSHLLLYGGNIEIEEEASNLTHTALLEGELALDRWIPYGRIEFAQKKGHDLNIGDQEEHVFSVGAFSLGSAVRLFGFAYLSFFAGAHGTINVPDRRLESYYGRFPVSYSFYVRVRPSPLTRSDQSTKHH